MTPAAVAQLGTLEKAQALKTRLSQLRRQIHSNPELGFQEYATSSLVASILAELGCSVTRGVGGTGVVGELGKGRTVILRADMDALPIDEMANTQYASKTKGIMHACGHDAHVACALGAAMLLAESPPPGGCVRFIFQPSEEKVNEEGKSGATLMIEAGAAEGAEAAFALHVDPRMPAGQVAVRDGALLAACDSFNIQVRGLGTHGAYPHTGIDAVVLASHVVQAVQTIVSRRKSALAPAVVTIGGIKSSSYVHNVTAGEVDLIGTVRYFDKPTGRLLADEIRKACEITTALGGSYELSYASDNPALVNDPQLTDLARKTIVQLLGSESVVQAGRETGGDDFTFFAAHIPGCYFLLGAGMEGKPCSIHTPTFDLDEDALPIGAALLAEMAARYLAS